MKRFFVIAGVLVCVALLLAVGSVCGALAEFQQPPIATSVAPEWQTAAGGKMSFEVVSIHPSEPGAVAHAAFPLSPDDGYSPTGGLFRVESFPLVNYVTFAYKLSLSPDEQQALLSQMPKWVATDRFTIQARAASNNPTKDQMRLMVQSLLAERFKLTVYFEKQELPALALVLAQPGKLGPTLRPHSDGPPCDLPSPPFGNCERFSLEQNGSKLVANSRNSTMVNIAASFSRSLGGRPVVDQTGLLGKFDFTIEWTLEPASVNSPIGTAPDTAAQGITFMEALRDQLGLKVESRKALLNVLIIDHVERPTLD